jgi:hypothetical protein
MISFIINIKSLKVKMIMCVLSAIQTVIVSAGTYYVSKAGDNSNNGSYDAPWLTLLKASERLVAGDTVYILPGVYHEILCPLNSGTESAPVCYFGESVGEVIVKPDKAGEDCGAFTILGKGKPGFIKPVNYIHVKGITFRGSKYFGISIYGGDDGLSGNHCVFENVKCDSNNVGTFFTCRDLVVRNSEFTANRYGGFWVFNGGSNMKISGCSFHHNGIKGNEDGMTLQDCENILVEDCEAYGQYDGFDIGSQKDEKTGPGCRYIILRRCRAYNNYNGNMPSSTTLTGPVCYQYCTARDNRDWAGGMVMYEAARNVHIWNCTITRVNVGINFWQGPGPVYLFNNIIKADIDAIRNEAGGKIISGCNFLSGTTAGIDMSVNISTGSVNFVDERGNDFRLATGNSALVDKGWFFLHTRGTGKDVSSITVDKDPRIYFFQGDTIQVQNNGIHVVKSMTENSIELSGERISYSGGLGIHTRYNGEAPDPGAFEYEGQ